MDFTDKSKIKGITFMLFSAGGFAIMNLFVRLAGDVPTIQKTFFRNLISFFIALIIYKTKDIDYRPKGKDLGLLTLRSLAGTLGLIANFYAVDHLPLSDASVLNKTSPFFTILFSYILLKENISKKQMAAIVTAFIGVIFISKPSMEIESHLPYVIGLGGGLFAGMAYTFVRKLGTKGVNSSFIVMFFSLFSTIFVLIPTIFNYHPMTARQVAYLLLAGLGATAGQYGLTFAYKLAPAKEISIYDYSMVVFSTIIGLLFFSEVPTPSSILGIAIVFAGFFITTRP